MQLSCLLAVMGDGGARDAAGWIPGGRNDLAERDWHMREAAVCSSVALIAEDEWLVRMDIADALLNAGWQVIEAATGEQALTLADGARANGVGVVDLLVTDIRLGGAMNGWDLAEALRLKRPDIAVVYASATPAAETRQVAGSAFVEKPFRIDTLMRICSRLTGHGAPC